MEVVTYHITRHHDVMDEDMSISSIMILGIRTVLP